VREDSLGAPFAFFQMTPVAAAVAAAGVGYICLIGWRLAPRRDSGEDAPKESYAVFEIGPLSQNFNFFFVQPLRLCGSVVKETAGKITTETQRLHREKAI
jgi:hypothetical protein